MHETVDPGVTQDNRLLALIAHLLGLFTQFLGPLIIYLVKKDSRFVQFHALQQLVFQLVMFVLWSVAGILTMVLIGLFLLPVLLIAHFVFPILGAVKAYNGEWYEFPLVGAWCRKQVEGQV